MTKYRCKTKNAKLWAQCLTIHEKFTSPKSLRELYNGYTSQKCEHINSRISQICPKDRTYSGTQALLGRVSYVVVLDTLGYKTGLEVLGGMLGFDLPSGTTSFLQSLDEKKRKKSEYQKLEEVRKRRGEDLNLKIRVELKKRGVEVAGGNQYASGVAMLESDDDIEENDNVRGESRNTGTYTCSECGKQGHRAGMKDCKRPDPVRKRWREERRRQRQLKRKREARSTTLRKFADSEGSLRKGEKDVWVASCVNSSELVLIFSRTVFESLVPVSST